MINKTKYTEELLLELLPSLIQNKEVGVMSDTDLFCIDLFTDTVGWKFLTIEYIDDDEIYIEILHTYDKYKYLEDSREKNIYRIWVEKKDLERTIN